jgi:hypothetical protein
LCIALMNDFIPSSSCPIFTTTQLFRNPLATDKWVSCSCNHFTAYLTVYNITNSVHKPLFFRVIKNSNHFDSLTTEHTQVFKPFSLHVSATSGPQWDTKNLKRIHPLAPYFPSYDHFTGFLTYYKVFRKNSNGAFSTRNFPHR